MYSVGTSCGNRACSPDSIASFIQQTIVELQSFHEEIRRSERRESVAIPLIVIPLDGDLNPAGDAFSAVTRDVSCSGIGLFHTKQITAPWLEIEMSSPATREEMRLLAKVQHCTPVGKFFLIGCQFAGSHAE